MMVQAKQSRNRQQQPVRVMIVDDHELARSGLRAMMSGVPGVNLVGEASNGKEAFQLVPTLCPDLILMDVRMPEMDGLAATRAIKNERPETSIIIITMHENPDYLLEALKAGAAGYLLKDATQREVIEAVRQVLRGESILSPDLATQLLQRLASEPARTGSADIERLTARETDVLRLLVQGQTNKEIAFNLSISVGTVKVHVEHIIGKLGASDRTQAAVRAVQLGLLSPA